MTNWFWVIPWVVIIIFFAGWKIGEKVSKKRWEAKDRENRDSEYYRRMTEDQVASLYKAVKDLEKSNNKEEKNNG